MLLQWSWCLCLASNNTNEKYKALKHDTSHWYHTHSPITTCSSLHTTQMAKLISVTSALKVAVYLFLLTISLRCVSSARILNEDEATVDTPIAEETPTDPAISPVASVVATPADGVPSTTGPAAEAATGTVANDAQPPLTFFMHDIVGGSSPSTTMVTGIVASSGVNTQLPFSNSNGVIPVNGGVPLVNGNNGVSTTTIPFVTGTGPSISVQNNGNGIGQMAAMSSAQKLTFGCITVIDEQLTEANELGSPMVGKAQGFYLASSQEGSSQTMALTVLLHGIGVEQEHEDDTISFFGIHQTAAPLSHIAVIGGTGKYDNCKGYATIETLHDVNQHVTDGAETVLKISIYLAP